MTCNSENPLAGLTTEELLRCDGRNRLVWAEIRRRLERLEACEKALKEISDCVLWADAVRIADAALGEAVKRG